MYYYKDKTYYQALKEYKEGNNVPVINKLNLIIKQNQPKFNEDISAFITEAQNIAKSRKDNKVLGYTKELGKIISKRDGNSSGFTTSYENALETENECILLLKESIKNDYFVVAINSIIEYITKNKNFHTAYIILYKINSLNSIGPTYTKDEIALFFIEKMFSVIVEKVKPIQKGLLIKTYSSEWVLFSSRDFIKYQNLVKKYTNQYSIKQCAKICNNKTFLVSKEKNLSTISINKTEIINAKKTIKNAFPYRFCQDDILLDINQIKYDGEVLKIFFVCNSNYNGFIQFFANNMSSAKCKFSCFDQTAKIVCPGLNSCYIDIIYGYSYSNPERHSQISINILSDSQNYYVIPLHWTRRR